MWTTGIRAITIWLCLRAKPEYMEDNRDVIVEVDLKPNDVYTPFRWQRGNLARWIAAFLLCVIFYDLYKGSSALLSFPDGKSILTVAALLALFILFALLLFPYLRLHAVFKKSPALTKKRRYTIGIGGIGISSDDASSDCKWSLFQRAVETPSVFCLFTSSHHATYIPKRCFNSPNDVAHLRQLIRENMPGRCQLRSD